MDLVKWPTKNCLEWIDGIISYKCRRRWENNLFSNLRQEKKEEILGEEEEKQTEINGGGVYLAANFMHNTRVAHNKATINQHTIYSKSIMFQRFWENICEKRRIDQPGAFLSTEKKWKDLNDT